MTDPVASAPLLDPSASFPAGSPDYPTTPEEAKALVEKTLAHRSQDMVPELISRSSIGSANGTEITTVELVPPTTATPTLPRGTRVRWYVTTPGGPLGTLFGRVTAPPAEAIEGLLYVLEEGAGKLWALNPGTDHLAVLSKT